MKTQRGFTLIELAMVLVVPNIPADCSYYQ